MPLPAIANLIYGKAKMPPMQLPFSLTDVARRQTRFIGKSKMTPEINLRDYRFVALVDFVVIGVVFARSTNAQTVQKVLRRFLPWDSWIEPLNEGPGGAASMFFITIQEPKSFAHLTVIYSALAQKFGEGADPMVSKIEFSVDAYPRIPSDAARAKLLGVMQRTIMPNFDFLTDPDNRPRSTIGKPTGAKIDTNNRKLLPLNRLGIRDPHLWQKHEDHMAPFTDGTMYIGARDADIMIRLQDKLIDRQNRPAGTHVDLTESEKRVRIEVTLQGGALLKAGILALRDLKFFSFARLQGSFFQFMLPTFEARSSTGSSILAVTRHFVDPCRARAFLKSGMLGLQTMDVERRICREQMRARSRSDLRARGLTIRRQRSGSGRNFDYVAYDALNRSVATAFRHLQQREANAW